MPRRIGFGRIFQVALEHGWDGRAQAASTAAANNNAATSLQVVGVAQAFGAATTSERAFFSPVPIDASNLRPVSWLASGLLLSGEIAILASQGGGAKTALAVLIAVALTAGRHRIGPFPVNNRPGGLRVAYLSAEEDRNRLGLLVAAASRVLALDGNERALVAQNLLFHDAQSSGWRLGAPQPGHRGDIAPEAEDRALNQLTANLTGVEVLILDTMAALFALPNENDNAAATLLMRRLTAAARQAGCAVLLLHHTPKQTREAAAAQRGEVTLIRGGSAIVNSARVVLTITAPPAVEAAQFVIHGLQPDRVRRIEHAKLNDAPPMEPAYFTLRSELIRVCDGGEVSVRAVEFITPPATGASGITDAVRNVVMKAVDVGVLDDHGARVPLSPSAKSGRRDAGAAITRALINANSALTEPQAKHLGREVLKDLTERIGCVIDQRDVPIPQYKKTGQPNGTQPGRGLVARWNLATWVRTPGAEQPIAAAPDGADE